MSNANNNVNERKEVTPVSRRFFGTDINKKENKQERGLTRACSATNDIIDSVVFCNTNPLQPSPALLKYEPSSLPMSTLGAMGDDYERSYRNKENYDRDAFGLHVKLESRLNKSADSFDSDDSAEMLNPYSPRKVRAVAQHCRGQKDGFVKWNSQIPLVQPSISSNPQSSKQKAQVSSSSRKKDNSKLNINDSNPRPPIPR